MFNTHLINSENDFVESCVKYLRDAISDALARGDDAQCVVGLSGGSTPGPAYAALAERYKDELDWSRVTLFLIDDRYVPSDHKDSNQKLVKETFAPVLHKLRALILPRSDTIRDDWKRCAADYSEQLREIAGRVDVMVFGLGPDGHFASLFPPVPDEAFTDDGKTFAVATETDQFAIRERISVNFAFLKSQEKNDARSVFFLKGRDKRKVWDDMVQAMPEDRSKVTRETVKRWPAIELLYSQKTDVLLLDPSE